MHWPLLHNSGMNMKNHRIRVVPSRQPIDRQDQLAWKIAGVASDLAPVEADVEAMVVNRIIDNAGVALAAINREPVANARTQALAHPRPGGATPWPPTGRSATASSSSANWWRRCVTAPIWWSTHHASRLASCASSSPPASHPTAPLV